MPDTFNPECPNCKITIGRIEKWIDHINITPNKNQRYDRLLCFVKMASQLKDETVTIKWIREYSSDILKDIGEYG